MINRDRRSMVFLQLIILVILVLLIYFITVDPFHEHSAQGGEWITDVEPTCTQTGRKHQVCTDCGEKFADTVIPANGHAELERKEHEIASTCTKGGSYENVTYCEVCDEELSRETVQVELKPHTRSYSYKVENKVNSTHASKGTYDHVLYCRVCGAEMERLKKTTSPLGHDYEWELVYDEDEDEFKLIGTCDCEEEGKVYTYVCDPDTDLELDTSVPTCCQKIYTARVMIEGKYIVESVEVEPDSHVIADSEDETHRVNIEDFAEYDPLYGKYYNIDGELGELIGLVAKDEGHPEADWNEYGFAYGAYQCAVCVEEDCTKCECKWFIVLVYSSKYDTRVNNQ